MTLSQTAENAIKNPNYNPYCMRCVGLVRMRRVELFAWRCHCGAIHDEQEDVIAEFLRLRDENEELRQEVNAHRARLIEQAMADQSPGMTADQFRAWLAGETERVLAEANDPGENQREEQGDVRD